MSDYKTIIETILYASDKPLSIKVISNALSDDLSFTKIKEIINQIDNEFSQNNKGIYIKEISNTYQIRTHRKFDKYIKKASLSKNKITLSNASYEVLSIICFKQPVSKLEIENIRGVDCSGIIKNLLNKKIIKISGRDTVNSKSLVYKTTDLFLELFGIANLKDLPTYKELKNIIKENETE
tara:strand:+ start:12444 stop:12986 length:543 start_codon:yes stop_codon:yes gene_type:complete